jgi:Rieske Fe-S protein
MVEPKRSRRTFLNYVLGGGLVGWLGAVLYPVASYLRPPEDKGADVASVKWGPEVDFRPGTSAIVKFGRKPVILIRTESGEFRAFDATCTHLDCTVQYRADQRDIWCACHNGVYDLRGQNVSGPPPRPLGAYAVNIVDGDVVIARMEA